MSRGMPLVWLIMALAVGFLAGLFVAALTTGSYLAVKEQRDSLREELDAARDDNRTLRRSVAVAREEVEAIKKVGDVTAKNASMIEDKKAAAEKAHKEMSVKWLKSQALLGLLARFPEFCSIFLGTKFRAEFQADWFCPDAAIKLVGTEWFADELIAAGMVPKEDLKAAAANPVWVRVANWRVDGHRTTGPFGIASQVWRVRWRPEDNLAVAVRIVAADTGEGVSPAATDEDGYLMRTRPGLYRLEIHSACPSDLFVEQLQ